MTIKSHKTILNLFFCTLALITLSACNAGGGGGAGATFAIDSGPVDPTIGYQASAADEIPPDDGWRKALSDARTTEYKASGGADRIGAAYAYARGYTGEGTIISMMMTQPIDSGHTDLSATGKLIDGYKSATNADRTNPDTTASAGTCAGATNCGDDILGTHIAALIAGESDDEGVQGIAYNAKIKPIYLNPNDLAFDSTLTLDTLQKREAESVLARANRARAIAAASGMVD